MKVLFILQMQVVKTWLFENYQPDQVPVGEMNLVLNQVDNNSVGIHAGNIFTLSYGSIAQVTVSYKTSLLMLYDVLKSFNVALF